MSLRDGRGVLYYTSGTATITVHFPEDQAVCRWCPYVRYDESLRRHRCVFTGEYLPYPMDTRGNMCPVEINENENKEEQS